MELLFILVRIALSSKCEYYDMNLGPQTKGKISWQPFLLLALNYATELTYLPNTAIGSLEEAGHSQGTQLPCPWPFADWSLDWSSS